jgi:hypothetical protein
LLQETVLGLLLTPALTHFWQFSPLAITENIGITFTFLQPDFAFPTNI